MKRPANQTVELAAAFGPDPRARLARGLSTQLQRYLQSGYTPCYGPSEITPGRFWPGYAPSPQNFLGMAGQGGSAVVYRSGGFPQTDSGVIVGPLGDPSRRIFAERLARRQVGF